MEMEPERVAVPELAQVFHTDMDPGVSWSASPSELFQSRKRVGSLVLQRFRSFRSILSHGVFSYWHNGDFPVLAYRFCYDAPRGHIWSCAVPELSVIANVLGSVAPKRARQERHRATLP